MTETASEKEQTMRDYLLGKMEAEEFAVCEDVWFGNDEESEQLEIVRAELIDEFLTNSFSPAEKRDFERYFLASQNNINLIAVTRIHRELIDKKTIADFDRTALTVDSKTERNFYAWQKIKNLFSFNVPQLAVAASVIVITFGLIFALRLFTGSENQIAQVIVPMPSGVPTQTTTPVVSPTPASRLETPVLQKPLPTSTQRKDDVSIKPPETRAAETPPPAPKQKNSIATLALVLGVRGGSAKQPKPLEVYKETKTVRLTYKMPALMQNYDEFSVSVIDEKSGQAVFEGKLPDLNIRQKGATLFTSIPAVRLKKGDYQLQLIGKSKDEQAEKLSVFAFKVNQK